MDDIVGDLTEDSSTLTTEQKSGIKKLVSHFIWMSKQSNLMDMLAPEASDAIKTIARLDTRRITVDDVRNQIDDGIMTISKLADTHKLVR